MNARDIPKTVVVGGVIIRIQVAEIGDNYGAYYHDDRIIRLSPNTLRKRSDVVSTLRHELLHAALQTAGIGFSELYDEEAIVRCVDNIFWPSWDRLRKKLEPKTE